jgi:hypothetical protein
MNVKTWFITADCGDTDRSEGMRICDVWTAGDIVREEHRLGAFENGVLRKVFGPKRETVNRSLKKIT